MAKALSLAAALLVLRTAAGGEAEAAGPAAGVPAAPDGIWLPGPVDEGPGGAAAARRFAVRLDAAMLDEALARVAVAGPDAPLLALPMPDGTFARFAVEPAAVPPEQAPALRAFRGRTPSGDLSARIEVTAAGLHAVLTGPGGGPVFVDPDPGAGPGGHVAYRARDADRPLVAGGRLPLAAVRRIESEMAEKARRTPAQRKIGTHLLDALRGPAVPRGLDADGTGRVLVDITAEVSPALLGRVADLGGTVVDSVARYRAVRARLPLQALEALAAEDAVVLIEPADIAVANGEAGGTRGAGPNGAGATAAAGRNTSEGDAAHAADAARERFGVDGTGIGIGVLSNGIRTLADRQATGDLPPRVTVLPGQEGVDDEGTAMLEIVHDLAPGAHLYFATAFTGEARFAANIEALCDAGADVIVDDVFYHGEGTFQDGAVARGINAAAAKGCFHVTAAGNSGSLDAGTAGVWEGDFAPAEGEPPPGAEGTVHDFGDGANSNRIEQLGRQVQLKWADPLGASANDYDLYVFDGTLTELRGRSTGYQAGSGDPYESILPYHAAVGDRVVVVKGLPPPEDPASTNEDRYLRVNTIGGRLEHATAGQIFGHFGARNAVTAGAVDARSAGGGDGVFDGSETVEIFSSDGPRRIFFEPDGTPITPGDFGAEGGEVVAKPDLAAADGVSTATPGFGDFHGTSAAAPHAAAIAALALQAAGGPRRATMAELRAALASGALDIGAEGADRNAGAGIAMAPAAVEALRSADAHRAPTVAAAIADRSLIALSDPDTVDLDLHFEDADGDALTYSVRVDDPAVVAAEIEGSTLSIAPGERSTTAVTVRATDPGGLSALTSFAVAVDREWGSTDYDADDDGLIEISTLEQLDAVRHDLDGDSVEDEPEAGPPYFGAFPDAARDMGCATGCTGFELTRDLDFDDPASYASGRADRGWSAAEGGPGWKPIGAVVSVDPIAGPRFDADFLGNGHAIANLFVDRPETDGVGLFGHVGGTHPPGRTIGGLALVDVDVAGRDYVGGLVGAHDEYRAAAVPAVAYYWLRDVVVVGVRVQGRVSGRNAVGGLAGLGGLQTARSFAAVRVSGEARVGGLVGETDDIRHAFGTISESYATGPVSGDDRVGGLVGEHHGVVSACYATGRVRAARRAGGLVGAAHGEVGASYSTGPVLGGTRGGLFGFVDRGTPLRASYWDVETSGVADDQGPLGRSAGRTTAELAVPGGYRGPYANWNVDLDRDDRGRTARGPDDPWHFGGKSQYPALRGDAATGWRGFGRQLRERPRLSLAASDGIAELAWTEPGTAHWSPPPAVVYDVYRNDALLAAGVDGTALRDVPPSGTAAHRYQVVARIGEGEPVRSNVAAVGNRPPFAVPLADRVARADEAFGYAFAAAGDPDGDAVAYHARGMPAWLSFDPASRSFSGTPAEGDAGATTVEVTATDAGTPTLSTVATFALTVNPPEADNRAPEATGAIAALSMATGDVEAVAVADAFEDPDGDALAFEAAAADAGVAAAAATGAAVTVTATGAGRTTVTVTASDGGLEAERTFAVGVANAPPRAAGAVAELRLTVPGAAATVDVGALFEDPDGDELAYSARSSDPGVAAVELEGALATVAPARAGRATLTISAADSGGSRSTARQSTAVVVEADYDVDDDGLVEIGRLAQLDVIRHDMDGDGLVSDLGKRRLNYPGRLARYEAAFPQAAPGMGCPAGCVGYELAADLDFDTDGDGRVGPGDAFWNDGAGWDPLGGFTPYADVLLIPRNSAFRGVFEGNGHAISHLFIDLPTSGIGLFGRTARSGTVRNVRLAGADVSGGSFHVGTLVGDHDGSVHGSSATGSVSGGSNVGGLVGYADIGSEVGAGSAYVRTTGESGVGGLIGRNWGTVRDVRAAGEVTGSGFDVGGLVGANYTYGRVSSGYATGNVSADNQIGGLVGTNYGAIIASYATGTVRGGGSLGGLVGWNPGTVSASYAATIVPAQRPGTRPGELVGRNLGSITAAYSHRLGDGGIAVGEPRSRRGSRTTADLLTPAGYAGIYAEWNVDLDGDGEKDDPWTFGSGLYPVLKLDADGDGTATWREFGPQRGPARLRIAAAEPENGSGDPGIVASWDPPADTVGAVVLGYEVQRRVGGGIFLAADPPHEGTATEYADDAPPTGAGHAYRVRALTDEGPTGWSPPASTAPGAPGLEAVPHTGGAVLTWTDPDDTGTSAISGYQYQRHAEGADAWDPPWTDVPADAAAERSYTVDGLVDGTRYGFELRAVNASGPGFGSARAMVVAGTPGPPRDLRAVAGDGMVTLGWTPPADPGASPVTGYEHRHSGDGGANWLSAWTPIPGGPVQEHAVAGLANAAAYVFEVRAVNDVGPGPGARVDVRTPPAATGSIPPLSFAAHGDEATVDLGRFFAVAPGGTLSFEARSADPGLVSVRVEGDRLVLAPNDDGEDGGTTVTVRAVDGEGRAVETVFAVSVEPLPGWWRRWGFDVVAELLAREPAEGMPARAE